MKELKERVEELEKEEEKKGHGRVIVIKKTNLQDKIINSIETTSSDDHECSMAMLPEIGARNLGKEVLIEIHCERENGIELKILDHLENLHLSITGTSVSPFGNSSLSVTVTAQVCYCYELRLSVSNLCYIN